MDGTPGDPCSGGAKEMLILCSSALRWPCRSEEKDYGSSISWKTSFLKDRVETLLNLITMALLLNLRMAFIQYLHT